MPDPETVVARAVTTAGSAKSGSSAAATLAITRPLGGAVFLYDPTLRPEYQALALSARGGSGAREWFVDGERIGGSSPDGVMRWPLRRGAHEIVVRDAAGTSARTHIDVR
jgi:membrane carboxypeptidase/penicillin-binding protein PbpC